MRKHLIAYIKATRTQQANARVQALRNIMLLPVVMLRKRSGDMRKLRTHLNNMLSQDANVELQKPEQRVFKPMDPLMRRIKRCIGHVRNGHIGRAAGLSGVS